MQPPHKGKARRVKTQAQAARSPIIKIWLFLPLIVSRYQPQRLDQLGVALSAQDCILTAQRSRIYRPERTELVASTQIQCQVE